MSSSNKDSERLHMQKVASLTFLARTDNRQNWFLWFSDGIPIMKPCTQEEGMRDASVAVRRVVIEWGPY